MTNQTANNRGEVIQDRRFDQTYVGGNLDAYLIQLPYKLDKADFIHLKARGFWHDWLPITFFGGFLVQGAILLGKHLYLSIGGRGSQSDTVIIHIWELWVLGVLLFLTLIAYLVSRCFSSEKKRIIDQIKSHFKDNPDVVEIRRKI